MFGGQPLPVEFERAREHGAGFKRGRRWYAEPIALATREPHDRTLYAAARVRFLRQIRNVTGGWRCAFDDDPTGRRLPSLMCTRRALSRYNPSEALWKLANLTAGASDAALSTTQGPATLGIVGRGSRHRAASWHASVAIN